MRFLRGSKAKDIYDWMRTLPHYAKGNDQPEKFWSELYGRLLAEGWLREKNKTGTHGMSYTVMSLHTKAQQWLRQYERDTSVKVELQMTEFLKLPGEVQVNAKKTPGKVQVSHLVTLPSLPVHSEDLIKRFMRGPWVINDETPRVASDEIKRLERQLYQLLRALRTRIAEQYSSMFLLSSCIIRLFKLSLDESLTWSLSSSHTRVTRHLLERVVQDSTRYGRVDAVC